MDASAQLERLLIENGCSAQQATALAERVQALVRQVVQEMRDEELYGPARQRPQLRVIN